MTKRRSREIVRSPELRHLKVAIDDFVISRRSWAEDPAFAADGASRLHPGLRALAPRASEGL